MDVGRFARRKTELWAWVLGPVLLIWILHAGALLFHLNAEGRLAGLKAHSDIVPRLREAIENAETNLAAVCALPSGQSEAMAAVTRLVDAAEKESGFAVSSVRADEGPKSNLPDVSSLHIIVEGEGAFIDVIEFVDAVQQPGHLIDVYVTNLNVIPRYLGTIYSAKFEFRCYNVGSVRSGAKQAQAAGSRGQTA